MPNETHISIERIQAVDATTLEQLVKLWRGSVEATHHFLTKPEIDRIEEYVPEAIGSVEALYVARAPSGRFVGFMGLAGTSLEMLFVAADCRRMGIGRSLLEQGRADRRIDRVAVNEQNPQARAFYERMGFSVYKRTETDEQGGPYPLLYMRLESTAS